jgi:hypothetical protein
MGALKDASSYTGLTTEQLLALAADHEVWTINWAFFMELQEKADRLGGEDKLAWEELVVIVKHDIDVEVNNGGWSQFFTNSSKRHAPYAVRAMEAIGHQQAADVTRQAVAALKIEEPFTEDEVDGAMDDREQEIEEVLDPLDNIWYDEIGGVDDELFDYIKRNKDKITIP